MTDELIRVLMVDDDQDDYVLVRDMLTLAGILHRKGKEYFFTSPVFTKVLHQTYDLEYLFRKVKEEGV